MMLSTSLGSVTSPSRFTPTGLLRLRVLWPPIGGHFVENDWFQLPEHHSANNLEQCRVVSRQVVEILAHLS